MRLFLDAYFPTDIVQAIRQGYSEDQLQSPSWCEDFNFRLDDLFTGLTGGGIGKPTTHLASIFSLGKHALIVGKPGIGKTAYCQKLAYDWAVKRNEFEKFLPQIQVLLSLKCCDISSNIWEAIDAQLLPDDVNEECKEMFFTFVRENQSKVLLILDGLDDVSPDQIQIISQLVERELPQCYFLLTSERVLTGKLRGCCNIQLEIVGFTEEEAKKFISNHFDDQKTFAQKLFGAIDKFDYLRKMVTGNPIYTALLCLLCRDLNGDIDIPTSRTQLYMEMLLCALRRFDVAKGGSSSDGDLMVVYKDQLTCLGLIDFNYQHKGDLGFEKDEVAFTVKDLLEFGFMSAQSPSCTRRPRLWYAFQQFFAGFYLASQIVTGKIDLKALVADERYRDGIFQNRPLSNVFVFMSGILELLSEEKALDLVSNMCSHINSMRPVSVPDLQQLRDVFLLALECREDASEHKDGLNSKLTSMLGSCLKLEKLSLGESTDSMMQDLLECYAFKDIPDGDPRYIYLNHVKLFSELLVSNTTLSTLYLRCIEIDDAGAIALSEALKANRSLTHVDLSGNNIGASGAQALSKALEDNSSLASLDLSRNKINRYGVQFLSEALKTNCVLSSLILQGNQFGGPKPRQDKLRRLWLSSMMKGVPSPEELKVCGDDEVRDACQGAYSLFESLIVNDTLSNLNLARTGLEWVDAYYLSESLKANSSLTALDLRENRVSCIGATCLAVALQTNSTLTYLNVGSCGIGDSGVKALCEALQHNTTLTNLDLTGTDIGSSRAKFLAEALSINNTLTTLNLNQTSTDALAAQFLSDALRVNTSLTTLHLDYSPSIGGAGVLFLSEFLENDATLTHLSLRFNGVEMRGVCHLFNALKCNTSLSSLDLTGNNIPWSQLSDALKVNTALTSLTLGENSITSSSGGEVFFEALKVNKTLKELNLFSMNRNFGYTIPATVFSEALKGNTALTHFNLSNNNLCDIHRIVPAIFEALQYNSTLTRLELSRVEIGDSECQSISESLKINTGLKDLDLSRNKFSVAGVQSIIEALKVNSTLKHLYLAQSTDYITRDQAKSLRNYVKGITDVFVLL